MRKSKLLILSTIAAFSTVAPIMTITSCGNNQSVSFSIAESKQETEIGKTACWYTFNLTRGDAIPSDLNVTFDNIPEYLVEQPLWHVNPDNPRQLLVGIDGKSKKLAGHEEQDIDFILNFDSANLGFKQTFPCTYVYHAPKVKSTDDRTISLSPSTLVEHLFYFSLVDTTIDFSDLEVSAIIVDKSLDLPDPIVEKNGIRNNIFSVKVTLPGGGSTIGKAGDYEIFDLEFHENGDTWRQVITNFSIQFETIDYQECTADTETDVVIDYKGNTQKALKATDNEGKGVLKPSTPIGNPFEITFNLSAWDDKWGQAKQWKFGSYVNPEQSHVPYYHYSSITVSAIFPDSNVEEPLRQTEPGDYEGENGLWWVSEGGPITVLYDKLIESKEEQKPTQIIYRLRTAEKITNESSFYITYA